MGIFNRTQSKAAISPPPKVAAAIGAPAGAQVGDFYTYTQGQLFDRAVSVPTIQRSLQLIASVIGSMRLCMYNEIWNETKRESERIRIAPRSWLSKINPNTTNNFMLSWTVSDIFMYGKAFWFISSRSADGFPASFSRLPAAMITSTDQTQYIWFSKANNLYFNGTQIDVNDVVQFVGGSVGLVYASQRTIATSIKLEEARYRNSSSAIPAGVLEVQAGSESLSPVELADLAASFNQARMTNQTAALSPEIRYKETLTSPDKMLLIDSATFQSMELSRATGVPAYLLNLSVGSYAYTNSVEARQDLWTFGCKQIAECITQTLSMNQITPQGTYIEFDIDDFIDGDIMKETETMTEINYTNGVTSAS
jgi:hypothetical protein